MSSIRVIDLFNTSLGEIAILEFSDGIIPFVGMIIKKDNNTAWKIYQIGMNSKFLKSDLYNGQSKPENTWDCNLKPINKNISLKIGDVLSI